MGILMKDILEKDNINDNNGKPVLLIGDNGELLDSLEQPVISLRKNVSDSYIVHGIGKMEVSGIITPKNSLSINTVGRCDAGIRGSKYEEYLILNRKLSIIYQLQNKLNKKIDIANMLNMSEEELRSYLRWSISAPFSELLEPLMTLSDLDIDSTFSSVLINGDGLRANTRKMVDICSKSKLPIRYISQDYIDIGEVSSGLSSARSISVFQSLFNLIDKNYAMSQYSAVLSNKRVKTISLISRKGI